MIGKIQNSPNFTSKVRISIKDLSEKETSYIKTAGNMLANNDRDDFVSITSIKSKDDKPQLLLFLEKEKNGKKYRKTGILDLVENFTEETLIKYYYENKNKMERVRR